jgi:hypothetical protein
LAAWRLSLFVLFLLAVLLAGLAGCDRGCGWLGERGVGVAPSVTGALPRPVVDCPDGLARCEEGTVSVSRLATLSSPCTGPATVCSCPWEAVAACPDGCAADGVELVVDRARAARQLCAPGRDGGAFVTSPATPAAAGDAAETPCDEGDRYLCAAGRVVECASGAAVGQCLRGCFADGTSIGDDGVSREAAFAILCSR